MPIVSAFANLNQPQHIRVSSVIVMQKLSKTNVTRELSTYLLHKYILGVLMHTTARDTQWEIMKYWTVVLKLITCSIFLPCLAAVDGFFGAISVVKR